MASLEGTAFSPGRYAALGTVPLIAAVDDIAAVHDGESVRAPDMRCHGTAVDLLYRVSDQSGASYTASEHALFLAASASETQALLPIGMMFLLPTLVAYSVCSYWIFFRGVGSAGEGIKGAGRRLRY
jgi:hypothetical protein